MKKLILTTANENYGIQNQDVLYTPIDPKYLYPEKNSWPYNGYLPSTGGSELSYIGPGLDDLLGQIQPGENQLVILGTHGT